jgi:hypothetical protein
MPSRRGTRDAATTRRPRRSAIVAAQVLAAGYGRGTVAYGHGMAALR